VRMRRILTYSRKVKTFLQYAQIHLIGSV